MKPTGNPSVRQALEAVIDEAVDGRISILDWFRALADRLRGEPDRAKTTSKRAGAHAVRLAKVAAKPRDDKTIKIDRTVAERAQFVARARKVTLAEYLTELVRGPVDKAYREQVKAMAAKIDK